MERSELQFKPAIRPQGPYILEEMQKLLMDIISEKTYDYHETLRKSRTVQHSALERNVAGIYFGTGLSLDEIGELMGIKGDNMRSLPAQKVKMFVYDSILNVSNRTGKRYPRKRVKGIIGKPKSEQMIDKQSEKSGGKRHELKKYILVDEIDDHNVLREKTGLTKGQYYVQIENLRKIFGDLIPL